MLRPPRHVLGLKWLALLALTLGCEAQIGDECSTGTDCSETGSRTCDRTMPNGYCTIFNCEPDECPGEAACIGFVLAPSTSSQCASTSEARERRSFCMLRCKSDGDCRSGYDCMDLNAEGNPWNAALLDKERSSGKVCTLAYSTMPAVETKNTAVDYCTAGTYTDDGYYGDSGGAGGQSGLPEAGATGLGGSTTVGSAQAGTGQAGGGQAGASSSSSSQ